jgi:hypothetical protein
VGKIDMEAYIYLVLGEIIVLYHKKFQNLNINKSYFCIFDGIRSELFQLEVEFVGKLVNA